MLLEFHLYYDKGISSEFIRSVLLNYQIRYRNEKDKMSNKVMKEVSNSTSPSQQCHDTSTDTCSISHSDMLSRSHPHFHTTSCT